MRVARYVVQGARYALLDTRYELRDAQYGVRGTRCEVRDTCYRLGGAEKKARFPGDTLIVERQE